MSVVITFNYNHYEIDVLALEFLINIFAEDVQRDLVVTHAWGVDDLNGYFTLSKPRALKHPNRLRLTAGGGLRGQEFTTA